MKVVEVRLGGSDKVSSKEWRGVKERSENAARTVPCGQSPPHLICGTADCMCTCQNVTAVQETTCATQPPVEITFSFPPSLFRIPAVRSHRPTGITQCCSATAVCPHALRVEGQTVLQRRNTHHLRSRYRYLFFAQRPPSRWLTRPSIHMSI